MSGARKPPAGLSAAGWLISSHSYLLHAARGCHLRTAGSRWGPTCLTEDNSDRLVGLLRDGRLDLALIGSAGEATPGIDAVVITDEELVAVADCGHPLADSGAITVGALRDVPLVSLPAAPARGRRSTPPAPRPGSPRIVFGASAPPMVVQMAARGLGLAVVPASTANGPQTLRTRTLQITSPQVRSRLELAWNSVPSASRATRVLIEHAKALGKVPSRSG